MSTNSKPPLRPAIPPVAGPDATGSQQSPIIKPLQPKPPRPKTPLFAGPAPPRPASPAPPPRPPPARPARPAPPPPTEPLPARPPATEPIPAPANNKPSGWWSRFTKKFGFRGKQANITTKTKKNNNKRTWFQKTRSAFVRIPINRALESIYKLGNKLNGSTGDKDIIAELETVIEALRTKLTTLSGSNNTAWGNGIHNDLGTFSRVLELYKTYYVTIQGYTLNLRTLQADLNKVSISAINTLKLNQLAEKLKYGVTEAVSAVCKNQPEDICTRVVNSRLTKPVVIANIQPPSPPFSNPMSARSSSQQSSVSRSHSSANIQALEQASNSKSRILNNILNNTTRPIKLGLTNNTTSRLRARLMGAKNNNKPLLTLESGQQKELLDRLTNYSSNTNLTKTAKAKLNIRPIIDGIPTKKRGPPVPARRRSSMIPPAFRNH